MRAREHVLIWAIVVVWAATTLYNLWTVLHH